MEGREEYDYSEVVEIKKKVKDEEFNPDKEEKGDSDPETLYEQPRKSRKEKKSADVHTAHKKDRKKKGEETKSNTRVAAEEEKYAPERPRKGKGKSKTRKGKENEDPKNTASSSPNVSPSASPPQRTPVEEEKQPPSKAVVKEKVEKKEKGGNPQKKKEKKPTTSKKGDINEKDTVNEYMLIQNRPYSIQNIFDNLHGSIKKPVLQKILDELVKSKDIQLKEFGKAQIYLTAQEKLGSLTEEELKVLDEQISGIKEEESTTGNAVKEEQNKGRAISKIITNKELALEIKAFEESNQELEKKIMTYETEERILISDIDMDLLLAKFNKCFGEYNRRKKGCMEMLNAVLENSEMTNAAFIELVGIETDQMAEFDPNKQ